MDLFAKTGTDHEPLAARMRPRNLDEYVGQSHIVGKGRLLRRAIQADQLSSLIFYGPPGTGKTTLAKVIAGTTQSRFLSLNAVLCGVKVVRESMKKAQDIRELYGNKTILFVDEVHRWNKAQQDALLPWVENGTIILIGATTENPYFEVNSALVSRSRIFQLTHLTDEELGEVADQALNDKERGYGKWKVSLNNDAKFHLIKTASGDARTLLNALQLAVETSPEAFPPPEGEMINITLEIAEESIQAKAVLYDKEGDYHFDTISAFIKSIRGSDPDAALYWLSVMIKGGEDPRFIFRRLIISASEDIGLADPHALPLVMAAAQAFDRIGMPEGMFPLSESTLYLATAPKSNSALALFDALKSVETEKAANVPNHLKDASRDKHSFGHGANYNYPHAYRDHWTTQQYLPDALKGRVFYNPTSQGYESRLQEDVIRKREAQMAAMMENISPEEVLTYSPGDKERDRWINRTISQKSGRFEKLRKEIFNTISVNRHDRILIDGVTTGWLLWESFRKVPEGGVWGLCSSQEFRDLNAFFLQSLPEPERPFLEVGTLKTAHQFCKEEAVDKWDIILIRKESPVRETGKIIDQLIPFLAENGKWTIMVPAPGEGTTLSKLISESSLIPDELIQKFRDTEDIIYTQQSGFRSLSDEAGSAGLKVTHQEILLFNESRLLKKEQIEAWFDPNKKNPYSESLHKAISKEESELLKSALMEEVGNKNLNWQSAELMICGSC